jgi:hypothetical protein
MAADNPREDIKVSPKFSLFLFGDGYMSQIAGPTVEYENKEGVKFIQYTIIPERLLRKKHNIKDSELNSDGAVTIQVNALDVIPLNIYDDSNRTFLYTKDYLHKETNLSRHFAVLTQRVEEEIKIRVMLEGYLIWYSEQLVLAKTNPAEFVSQGLEVLERVSEKFSDVLKANSQRRESEH